MNDCCGVKGGEVELFTSLAFATTFPSLSVHVSARKYAQNGDIVNGGEGFVVDGKEGNGMARADEGRGIPPLELKLPATE